MATLNERTQQAITVFSSLDRNGDGYLTREEFQQAVQRLGGGPPTPPTVNPEIEALFDTMDRDGDGHLSRAEFDELVRTLGQVPSPSIPPPPPPPLAFSAPRAWPAPQAFPVPSLPQKTVEVDVNLYSSIADRAYIKLLLCIGIVLMFLLTLVPLWNASFLLTDSTYVFFARKQAVWGIVLTGMCLAFCILIFGLTDARAAFANFPCGCCFGSIPRVGLDGVEMPSGPRCVDGVDIPFVGKVKLEAFIVTLLAIFLMLLWSMIPSLLGSFYSIPGVGSVFKMLSAPVSSVFSGFFVSFGPVLDATFSFVSWEAFFGGCNAASGVLLACWATYICYAVTLCSFFRSNRTSRLRSAPALACAWATFMIVLGVLFLVFASSISGQAFETYNDLFLTCATSDKTAPVYLISQELQELRLGTGCGDMLSVEDCEGFSPTTSSHYLKAMESQYRCRGFCFNAAIIPEADPAAMASTLYSSDAYVRTCDGAAAQSLDGTVAGAGSQIQYAGIFFIVIGLSVMILRAVDKRLEHVSRSDADDAKLGPLHGAEHYVHYGAVDNSNTPPVYGQQQHHGF